MDGIFFWTESSSKTDSFELHFNLWTEECYDHKFTPMLDIGVKIMEYEKLPILLFYFPFKITKDELTDLGCKLSDVETISAVFNDIYNVNLDANRQRIEISKKQDDGTNEHQFNIFSLDIGHHVTINDYNDGSIVRINVSSKDKLPLYIRFRLTTFDLKKIVNKKTEKMSILNGRLNCEYYLDFRFNDIRMIAPSFRDTYCFVQPNIAKLHFFIMAKSNVDIITSDQPRTRLLENRIWTQSYLKNIAVSDKIVAHHWKYNAKDGRPCVPCIIYSKIRVQKSTLKTLLFYTVFIIIMSIVANGLYDLIKSFICTTFIK